MANKQSVGIDYSNLQIIDGVVCVAVKVVVNKVIPRDLADRLVDLAIEAIEFEGEKE